MMGWAVIESDQIEQCRGEGWAALLKGHEGEGCRLYGYIKVSKVRILFIPVCLSASCFWLE